MNQVIQCCSRPQKGPRFVDKHTCTYNNTVAMIQSSSGPPMFKYFGKFLIFSISLIRHVAYRSSWHARLWCCRMSIKVAGKHIRQVTSKITCHKQPEDQARAPAKGLWVTFCMYVTVPASTIQMKILMMIWIFRLLPCPLLYCDWLYLRAILEHAVPTPLCKVSNDAHVPERHSTFRLHASTCRFAVFNTLDISAYICSEILQRSALHCSALHWQYDATMANCFDCNCLISYHTAHQPEKTALPNKLLLLQF